MGKAIKSRKSESDVRGNKGDPSAGLRFSGSKEHRNLIFLQNAFLKDLHCAQLESEDYSIREFFYRHELSYLFMNTLRFDFHLTAVRVEQNSVV